MNYSIEFSTIFSVYLSSHMAPIDPVKMKLTLLSTRAWLGTVNETGLVLYKYLQSQNKVINIEMLHYIPPHEFCIETSKSFLLFARSVWQVLNVFIGLFPVFAAVIPFAHSRSPDCQRKSVTSRIQVVLLSLVLGLELCRPGELETGDNILRFSTDQGLQTGRSLAHFNWTQLKQ